MLFRSDLEQAAQGTSSTSEESAATAEEMRRQTDQLRAIAASLQAYVQGHRG